MPRGRKPRPVELKVLSGAQPCRLGAEAARLEPGRPDPPAHLGPVARDAWARLCDSLSRMGVLSTAEAEALELYCVVYERWRDALDDVKRLGPTIDTTVIKLSDGTEIPNPKGCVKQNPALVIAATCEATMARLLASLGLTPADRARVKPLDQAGATTSKLAKFKAI